ncbi:MAG: EF-hand domain-containing protein [Myxococcota bacterium]
MSESKAVWRTVFSAFDRDHNGRIDRNELTRALKNLGGEWTETRIRDAFDSYDADASGGLNFEEFFALVTGAPAPANPELVRAFRAMDLDGDGAITANELKGLFDAAGVNAQAEVDEFIREGDLDGDGRITFDEFLKLAAGGD